MKIYTAEQVLDKTEFNNLVDWKAYPTADYCCDKCNQVVSIDFKSLNKHQFSDFSNLEAVDKETCMVLEATFPTTNSFLDFYCPKCRRPVRIYYDSWAGGKHGEAGHSIKYIIQ